MTEKLDALREMRVFEGLKDAELESIAAVAEPVACKKGETVFAQGDPGDSMYLVASGKVKVTKGAEAGRGNLRNVATVGEGDVLGEMALLLDEPRSATATAAGACELYRIRRTAFHKLRAKHDVGTCKVVYNLGRLLAARLRDLNDSLVGLTEKSESKSGPSAAELAELRESLFKKGFTI